MNKKTLVLGASTNPSRYSFLAINKLVDNQCEVVAIGLKKGKVAGVNIEIEKIPFNKIDTLTLYLNPQRQVEYYEYVLDLKPNRVIFNPGTENQEFYKILTEKGIKYEIACTLVLLGTNQY
ncbi:CoA-binding protein [uncultured Planktosalinus sp.]|uniref:CoA-binding protein n=1 Tax=uncultured Planktosalinus sp. TaxID=1810935 RepID=UPI0030D7637F